MGKKRVQFYAFFWVIARRQTQGNYKEGKHTTFRTRRKYETKETGYELRHYTSMYLDGEKL
jgi:hypothetical protein